MKNDFIDTNSVVEEIKPEYFDNGKVICQHCKKSFNIISPTHLKKEHDSNIEKYRKEFPDAPLSSQQFKAKQRFHASELFSDKSVPGKSEEEFFVDLIVKTDEQKKNEEAILSKLKQEIDSNSLIKDLKYQDKLDLFICIKNKFPNLKNNYRIEIVPLNGIVCFATITDMADPSNKVDFEFPKAFWHNEDRGPDYKT